MQGAGLWLLQSAELSQLIRDCDLCGKLLLAGRWIWEVWLIGGLADHITGVVWGNVVKWNTSKPDCKVYHRLILFWIRVLR